jgi:hypothetical protein
VSLTVRRAVESTALAPADPARATAGRHVLAVLRWVAAPFRDNAILLLILGPYVVAALIVERVTGLPVTTHLRDPQWVEAAHTVGSLYLFAAALTISAFGLHRIWALEHARRTGSEAPALPSGWRPYSVLLLALLRLMLCLMLLSAFFKAFLGLKAAIPHVHPFAWDTVLMELDRVLHFGYHPWQLLQPLIGYATATRFIDLAYYLWFPLNFALILWFGWMSDGPERRRFFLAYLSMWVLLGSIGAYALSSAGPCYLDLATGGDLGAYAPLMDYLRSIHDERPLYALAIQDALLDRYHTQGFQPLEGISAMPSLHVAAAALFTLAARRRSRLLAALFGMYAITILIGSVHLGWHYAVDGYVSAGAVLGIWWAAGQITSGDTAEPAGSRSTRRSYSGTGSLVR